MTSPQTSESQKLPAPDWVVVLVAFLFCDFALPFDVGVVLVNVVPVPADDVLAEVLVAVDVLVVL